MTCEVAVGLADAGHFEHRPSRGAVHRELDVRALDVRPGQLGGLQPLDFLAARRGLAGAGAGAEPRDEVLQLRDLLLALRVLRFDAGADLGLGQHHVVVAAGIRDDGLIVDVGGVGADVVEEVAIVRDDDQRALVAHQELAQPVDRVEVEVVGRLVQQQRLGPAEQRLGEQDADLLAALQLRHLALVQLFRNVEPLQQDRRIALRAVAVLVADDALQLAEAHAVLVGHRRLGVEQLALLERVPQPGVAHDDRVDDAEGVERELVLTEHAELLGTDDRSLLRRLLAGEQLHEGGLAGAVRARSGRSGVPPKRL